MLELFTNPIAIRLHELDSEDQAVWSTSARSRQLPAPPKRKLITISEV